MKKIITVSLAIILLVGFQSFAFAENGNKTYRTGLIWDTWDDIVGVATRPNSGLDIYNMSIRRMGDLDGDGQKTVADARLCLRASANLETLSEVQKNAADVFGTGSITSAAARKILRIAVGLESAETQTVEMTTEWGVIIGSLKNAGSGAYNWSCTTDDGLTVTQTWRSDKVVNPGDPVEQYFIFSAKEPGTYTAHFELRRSWEDVPIDEFDIKIVVK